MYLQYANHSIRAGGAFANPADRPGLSSLVLQSAQEKGPRTLIVRVPWYFVPPA